MNDRLVLRSGGRRFLDVTRQSDGSLRIHGHDIGGGAEIFGSDDYEWYKTIPAENIEQFRQVFGVPDGVDEIAFLEEHHSNDQGHSFETLVRENDLAERFWSWP